jgi:hypothetical protein
MSNINLNINFNPKVVAAVLIVIGIATLAYKTPETKAQASPALTGKFGCIGNTNTVPYLVAKAGQEAWVSSISYFDFDARLGSNIAAVTTNFNASGTSQRNDISTNISFTVSAGPITGSYTINFPWGSSYTMMPVNSGNTLLSVSSKLGSDHMVDMSVCQRI